MQLFDNYFRFTSRRLLNVQTGHLVRRRKSNLAWFRLLRVVLTVMLHEAVHIHEASSLALDTPVHLLATVDGHNVFGQVGQREGDVTVFTLACLPFRLGGHHARYR